MKALFNYSSIPEPSLEPPEDKRPVYANCMCCGKEIKDGDECYNIPTFGHVCTECIDHAYVSEVVMYD